MLKRLNSGHSEKNTVATVDEYDQTKFKLHANVRWLFAFIPTYHKDKVKDNVRKNLGSLQLPPKTADSVWRDIIALLVSCEVYRCACLTIFGPPAPLNHWDVIQSLSRHGFYVVNEDGSGVVQTSLLSASPFKQEAHVAVIDCLMQAYSCVIVTIPRVVSVVKRIGSFNASQDLPYDIEDSLLLWINKISTKVKKGLQDVAASKKEEIRQGIIHPTDENHVTPPIPVMEELIEDISDGQCLGVLIHYYLPQDLPLEALKFGKTLMQSEKASNMAAVRFAIMTSLGMAWFPMRMELILHPSFFVKPNIIVFLSELFWKFEMKGGSRTTYSSDSWLKEEARSGTLDMNCAAAATEISLQLEKCPVILEHVPTKYTMRIGNGDSDSSDNSDYGLSTPKLPPLIQQPILTPVKTRCLVEVQPQPIKDQPKPKPNFYEKPSGRTYEEVDVEEIQETGKYFDTSSPSPRPSLHTISDQSQSLGSLTRISTPDLLKSKRVETSVEAANITGPTTLSLKQLREATEPQPSASTVSGTECGGNKENIAEDTTPQEAQKHQQTPEKPPTTQTDILPTQTTKSPVISVSQKRRKSGEEIVELMKEQENEKREFYTNIAKWVASVEKECKTQPIPADELLNNPTLTKSLQNHFAKEPVLDLPSPTQIDTVMPHPSEMPIEGPNNATATRATVGQSFVISSETKEDAIRRGIPVISGDIPVTPAPAPPEKIKEDYLMTVHEREETIRKIKEAEEQKRKEELDRKRQLEEKLAEEKRMIDEMSDSSNKSVGSKKGKKAAAKGKKGASPKGKAAKEGKSFPRRPTSGGSNSSTGSNKSSVKGGKGAKGGKGKAKDDISVKSEKSIRSKQGKPEAKRRVKSARRPGKSVSFVDECAAEPTPDECTPVIELVPKSEPPPPPECPFKKDTKVIGEDSSSVKKSKMAFFVSLDDNGRGLGSGPILKQPLAYPQWDEDKSAEDSLQVMMDDDSESGLDSNSRDDGSSSSEESDQEEGHVADEAVQSITPITDVSHILESIKPQFGSEPAYIFERRVETPGSMSVPLPTEPRQLMLHLQMQEKKKNIQKYRTNLREQWEEERSKLNRHVFYEALKRTKDVSQQANSEDIRSEIEKSDSLEDLIPYHGDNEFKNNEPFNPTQRNPIATPTHKKPPTLLEKAIADTEAIFTPVKCVEYVDQPVEEDEIEHVQNNTLDSTSRTDLVCTFSDHGELLAKKQSTTTSSTSNTPKSQTTMQYFYGFTDVASDNKVAEKRQQFLIAQRKKQDEMKARRELEMQRKLEATRQKTHVEAELRRDEGNLVTKCRAKSARIRVVQDTSDVLITSRDTPARAKSACTTPTFMKCQTPEADSSHMYPDRSDSRQMENGGRTFRKISSDRSVNARSDRALSERPISDRSYHERGASAKITNHQQATIRSQKQHNYLDAGRCVSAPLVNGHVTKTRVNCHLHEQEQENKKRKDSSPKPPTVPLFVAPSAKNNSKVICNAVCWTCLSGVPDRRAQEEAILAITHNPALQYVILFRDTIAKKFRGIYTYQSDTKKLKKIYGVGPRTITHDMLNTLYKYDSGSRHFSIIPTNNFSMTVDAVTIQNSVWKKAGVLPT